MISSKVQNSIKDSKMISSHSGGDHLPPLNKKDINLIGLNYNNQMQLVPQQKQVILKMDKSIIFESVGSSGCYQESNRNTHSVYNSLAQSTDSQLVSPINNYPSQFLNNLSFKHKRETGVRSQYNNHNNKSNNNGVQLISSDGVNSSNCIVDEFEEYRRQSSP